MCVRVFVIVLFLSFEILLFQIIAIKNCFHKVNIEIAIVVGRLLRQLEIGIFRAIAVFIRQFPINSDSAFEREVKKRDKKREIEIEKSYESPSLSSKSSSSFGFVFRVNVIVVIPFASVPSQLSKSFFLTVIFKTNKIINNIKEFFFEKKSWSYLLLVRLGFESSLDIKVAANSLFLLLVEPTANVVRCKFALLCEAESNVTCILFIF